MSNILCPECGHDIFYFHDIHGCHAGVDWTPGGEKCKCKNSVGKLVETLAAERDALKAEVAEYREYHQRVMAEQCAPDEQHCTCVPALRAENAVLKAKNAELKGLAETLELNLRVRNTYLKLEHDALETQKAILVEALKWYADARNLYPDSAEGTTDIARVALEKVTK